MDRPRAPRTLRISRTGRVALWAVVLGIFAVRAGLTTADLVRALAAAGPNTTGEAGKVYFASRIQNSRSAFADGRSPPYYPSVHGALLHGSVAAVGRVLDASASELYPIGRIASLLMTAIALALLADLGRRMGVPIPLLAGGLLLWIGSFDLVHHTVSYRPDNWLLFLGALGCWIVAVRSDRPASLLVLVLLPALAFHVKSPGVAIGAAIVGSLVLQGRWRRGLVLGAIQVALLLLSIQALNLLSDGSYLAGLGGIGSVMASPRNVLLALNPGDPVIPWIVVFPLVWLPAMLRGWRAERRSPALPLLVFWFVTLVAYGAAAARSGSNTYYFLEPATYGLLLGLTWLERGRAGRHPDVPTSPLPARLVVVSLIMALLAFPPTVSLVVRGRIPDVAQFRTERLGPDRVRLAEHINATGLYCYSDDPGLNVLLDRPAVIYPLLQTQMIDAGTLPPGTLLRPVEEQEFDCVVLSGVRWAYRGRLVLPDTFFSTVARNYPRSEPVGNYQVRLPDSSAGIGVPSADIGPSAGLP